MQNRFPEPEWVVVETDGRGRITLPVIGTRMVDGREHALEILGQARHRLNQAVFNTAWDKIWESNLAERTKR